MNKSSGCLLGLFTTIFFVGCSSIPKSELPAIYFENGYNETYHSEFGIFFRDMCSSERDNVKAVLSSSQLKKIGELALTSGFFDLKHYLAGEESVQVSKPAVAGEEERICVVAPCPSYKLMIALNGTTNFVQWDCGCGNAKPPKEIAALLAEVKSSIYSLQSIKNMPPSSCRYY